MRNTVAKQENKALALGDALPTPADLDGWDSDDIRAGVEIACRSFRQYRLVIGLYLWKYRALNVDAVYGVLQSKVARDCDVDERTLQRWRVFAEKKWALPPPNRRTQAQRVAAAGRAVTDTVSLTEGEADDPTDKLSAKKGDGDPEKVTPDAVIDPTPDPKPTKKATQLSLFEEREGRMLVPARPPVSREEVVAAKRIAKAYLDWASQFEPDPPEKRPPPRPIKVPSTPSEIAAFMKNRGKK